MHIPTPVLLEYATAIQAPLSADPASSEARDNRHTGCSVPSGVGSSCTSSAESQAAKGVWTSTEDAERETFGCCGVCQPSELVILRGDFESVSYDNAHMSSWALPSSVNYSRAHKNCWCYLLFSMSSWFTFSSKSAYRLWSVWSSQVLSYVTFILELVCLTDDNCCSTGCYVLRLGVEVVILWAAWLHRGFTLGCFTWGCCSAIRLAYKLHGDTVLFVLCVLHSTIILGWVSFVSIHAIIDGCVQSGQGCTLR